MGIQWPKNKICRIETVVLDGIQYMGNRIFFHPKEDDLFYEADGATPVALPADLEAHIRENLERYLPTGTTQSKIQSHAHSQAA